MSVEKRQTTCNDERRSSHSRFEANNWNWQLWVVIEEIVLAYCEFSETHTCIWE
jgi:hypothetical protein